jgi:hypothetical protein
MDFSTLLPSAAPVVEAMPKMWPISMLQDVYAPFGALHLVGLALLGGCTILLNLRFLGAGLTTETPSTIEKNLRPWFITGVAIILGTGIIIGMLNSSKLYYSPAFLAKMAAMVAALTFSFGVTNSIAKNEGTITNPAKIAAVVAFALWLFSLYVFTTSTGVNPGTVHILTAALAMLVIFSGRMRWIAIGVVLLLMLAGGIYTYGVVGFDNDTLKFLEVTKIFVIVGAVILAGLVGFEIFTSKSEVAVASPLARLIALFAVLAWVTTAAGGRWIGFS